jgi:hypothetical protein
MDIRRLAGRKNRSPTPRIEAVNKSTKVAHRTYSIEIRRNIAIWR